MHLWQKRLFSIIRYSLAFTPWEETQNTFPSIKAHFSTIRTPCIDRYSKCTFSEFRFLINTAESGYAHVQRTHIVWTSYLLGICMYAWQYQCIQQPEHECIICGEEFADQWITVPINCPWRLKRIQLDTHQLPNNTVLSPNKLRPMYRCSVYKLKYKLL